jgi:putative DNA primase/helicase
LLNEQVALTNLKDGDGRRNALFKRIIPLANNGFTQNELKDLFKRMNLLFFEPTLTDAELASCFTDNEAIFAHESPYHLALSFFKLNDKGVPTVFLHNKFAKFLNKAFHCVFHQGQFYFYDGQVYSKDLRILFTAMNSIITTLKKAQRMETLNYMETSIDNEVKEVDYLLNVNNGFVNVLTGELIEHTPEYFDLNKVEVNYDSNVSTETLDTFIAQLCKNDKELIKVIEEIIGSFIIKNTKVQKAFVLKGYGANGKSTFLDILRNFFGSENISSVGIEELQERFKRSALVGKLINIAAEMPETNLTNLHIFKKLVTGDVVDAEFKGKDSFNFVNKAKFIFSANELPSVNDTTDGFTRRIMIIPFVQYFGEKSRDPDLILKLITDEQKSALLNIAIRGLNRLVANN